MRRRVVRLRFKKNKIPTGSNVVVIDDATGEQIRDIERLTLEFEPGEELIGYADRGRNEGPTRWEALDEVFVRLVEVIE